MLDELIAAIKAGNEERVRGLVSQDEELVNAKDGELPVVMLAAYHGQRAIAELLIALGAEADVFVAAALGNADRLAILLKGHREVANSYSGDGWTPLALAAHFGQAPAARLLLSVGAEVNARSRNANENTPLHAAVAGRRQELAQLLVEAGADVNARDAGGWTPMHLAAHGGAAGIVEALLAAGADPSIPNEEGQTPLQTAERQGHDEVVAVLRTAGEVQQR